tara:strand:- start:29137 stop:29328 length:192 start_codon:yes stop_codon:yes gene_type:complete
MGGKGTLIAGLAACFLPAGALVGLADGEPGVVFDIIMFYGGAICVYVGITLINLWTEENTDEN